MDEEKFDELKSNEEALNQTPIMENTEEVVETLDDDMAVNQTDDNALIGTLPEMDPVPEVIPAIASTSEESSNETYHASIASDSTSSETISEVSPPITDSTPFVPENSVQETSSYAEPNPISLKSGDSAPKYLGYGNRLVRKSAICIIAFALLLLFLVSYLNTNTTSNYTERSNVNYQVCLKENDYYTTSCVGENVEYLTAITDNIRTEFNYVAVFQEKEKRTARYYVKSKLLIKTVNEPERELLSKEKELIAPKDYTDDTNVINIIEIVDIPFQEYNSYAQKYKNDYSLLSNCQVIVSLVLLDENGKERELSSISIPLTKNTYNITKYDMKEQVNVYSVKSIEKIKNYYLIATIVFAVIALFTFYRLLRFLSSTHTKESEYNKKLKQILTTYDRVIITLSDKSTIVNDKAVYTVKSFLELLDVRDTIDKPILYYKVNSVKTEFYVQDVDKVYKYTMKEADFEKSNQGDV